MNRSRPFRFAGRALAILLLAACGAWADIAAIPAAESIEHGASAPESVPRAGLNTRIEAIALDLVWVAPGAFRMGTPSGEHADELPVRTVRISRGFWMGRTEVTQAQWRALMGDNPSYFEGDDLPVERVSWRQSVEFCRRLTELERQADACRRAMPTVCRPRRSGNTRPGAAPTGAKPSAPGATI